MSGIFEVVGQEERRDHNLSIYRQSSKTQELFAALAEKDSQRAISAIENGADVNAFSRQEVVFVPDVQTPLALASSSGLEGVVAVLIAEGAQLTIPDKFDTFVKLNGVAVVTLLKEGWKNFERCDLRECDLRDADLRGCNLRRCLLEGVDLSGSLLRGADLTKSSLIGANLRYALLADATLTGATLCPQSLWGAMKSGHSVFMSNKIIGSNDQPHLEGMSFNGATFLDADFQDVSLNSANFSGATFCGGNRFWRCDLRGTNFRGSNGEPPRFSECDLRGAKVGKAELGILNNLGPIQRIRREVSG